MPERVIGLLRPIGICMFYLQTRLKTLQSYVLCNGHPSLEMKKPTKKISPFCILDILVTIPYWICSRKILNFWPLGCVILKFFFEKVGIFIWKKNFRNPIFHYLQLCLYVLWSFFDLKQAKMKICLWKNRLWTLITLPNPAINISFMECWV